MNILIQPIVAQSTQLQALLGKSLELIGQPSNQSSGSLSTLVLNRSSLAVNKQHLCGMSGHIVLGDGLLVIVPFHLSKLHTQSVLEGDIMSLDIVRMEQNTPSSTPLGVPVDDQVLEVIDSLIDVGVIEDKDAAVSFIICVDGTIRELDDMSSCFIGGKERIARVFWAFPIIFRA